MKFNFTTKTWSAILAGVTAWLMMSIVPLHAVSADEYEWDPTYGYHEEEWYDPSDWFDPDDGIDYEGDYYGDYYDDDVYEGSETWYGDNYYSNDWYDDEPDFDNWYDDDYAYDDSEYESAGIDEYNEY